MDNLLSSLTIIAELIVLLLFLQLSKFTKAGWKDFVEDVSSKGSWEFIFDNFDYLIVYGANILILYTGLILSFISLDSENPYSIISYTLSILFMVFLAFTPIMSTNITRELIFDKQKSSWSLFLIIHVILSMGLTLVLFMSSRITGYSVSMGLIVLLIIMIDEYFFYYLVRMFSSLVSEDVYWAMGDEDARKKRE
ncbi:MAG: hypothetical protein K8R64_02295 [Methanosarcinaceae archaeon]|nr:hypothetical protein [Methanosarcinaceae archaeon]